MTSRILFVPGYRSWSHTKPSWKCKWPRDWIVLSKRCYFGSLQLMQHRSYLYSNQGIRFEPLLLLCSRSQDDDDNLSHDWLISTISQIKFSYQKHKEPLMLLEQQEFRLKEDFKTNLGWHSRKLEQSLNKFWGHHWFLLDLSILF